MKKLLAFVVCLAIASPALAIGCYSFSGPVSVPNDGYDGTLSSMASGTLTVPAGEPGGDIIFDIEVSVDATHTWVGDLTLKLAGPGGIITLMSRPGYAEPSDDGSGCCGDSSNWVAGGIQRFVDSAEISAEDLGLAQPSSADPIPAQNLNPHGGVTGDSSLVTTFRWTSAVGNWTLYMGDGDDPDIGVIRGWTLCINTIGDPTFCDDDLDCDDTNRCTEDYCVDGYCWHTPIGCDDGDSYTIDSCDPIGGCVHEHLPEYEPPPPCGTVCIEDDCAAYWVLIPEELDPVYLFTGEFYETATDLRIPGGSASNRL